MTSTKHLKGEPGAVLVQINNVKHFIRVTHNFDLIYSITPKTLCLFYCNANNGIVYNILRK